MSYRQTIIQLEAEVAALRARLAERQQYLPTCWFRRFTFIDGDALLKARKYIRHKRDGARWLWHVEDVFSRFPHLWISPFTNKPPELPQIAKPEKTAICLK